MKNKSITLVMPTLNEIGGLTECLPKIDRSLFNRVIIVDGGLLNEEYLRFLGDNFNNINQYWMPNRIRVFWFLRYVKVREFLNNDIINTKRKIIHGQNRFFSNRQTNITQPYSRRCFQHI